MASRSWPAGQIKVSDLAQSRPSVPPGFPGAYAPPASSGPPRTAAMGALQQQASPQQPLPQSGGLTAQGNGGLQFGSMGMPAVNQAQGQLWRGPQGPGAHYGGSAAPRLGYGSAMPPGGVDPGQGSAQRMGPAGLPPPVGPPAQQSHISAAPQTVSGPNAAPGGPVTGGGHYGSQGGGAFPGQVSPRGLRPPMGPARPEAGQGQQPPSAAAGMGRPGGQPTPSLQAPFGLAGLNLPPAEPRRAVPPSLPSHLDNMLPAQTSANGGQGPLCVTALCLPAKGTASDEGHLRDVPLDLLCTIHVVPYSRVLHAVPCTSRRACTAAAKRCECMDMHNHPLQV